LPLPLKILATWACAELAYKIYLLWICWETGNGRRASWAYTNRWIPLPARE